jgi:hypothetical protein
MKTAEGPIARYLSQDHARLDALLGRAVRSAGALDREAYDTFRAGLLWHIAVEEKILLPALRDALGGDPPERRRLRIDHGALAALLVGTPSRELVGEIRSILEPHNAVEEGGGGLYARCDELLAARGAEIVERIRAYPPVKVAAYADGPRVLRTAADALAMSSKQLDPSR